MLLAQVSLPNLGLDFSEVVDAVAAGVGPFITQVILLAGAVLCLTLGMKWMKRFVGGGDYSDRREFGEDDIPF